MLDIQKIRADFPILSQKVNGKPLVYFDNGATSQKPQIVIDAISKYYQEINANIHRLLLMLMKFHVVKFRTTSMPNFLMKYYLLLEPLLELI